MRGKTDSEPLHQRRAVLFSSGALGSRDAPIENSAVSLTPSPTQAESSTILE